MSPSTYEQLLGWLAPLILRKSTKMRESIGASERLPVTLRYCVTGNAQTTIAGSYKISQSMDSSYEGELFNLSIHGGRMERDMSEF